MIYEFSRDMAALIASKLYPVTVKYGPERVAREAYPGHVMVIERDEEQGDTVSAPTGMQEQPRRLFNCALGSKVTIFARSSLPGAHVGDHERECEKLRDAFLCAAYKWCTEGRAGVVAIGGAKYLGAKDRPDVEVWPGRVYEVKFKVTRGVYDRTYVAEQHAGAARPEGTPAGVGNRTDATAPGYDPATGCGAE